MFYSTENLVKFVLTFCFSMFYIRNIYNNNYGVKIDTDNLMNITIYENNMNFSKYSTDIKAIVLYHSNYYQFTVYNRTLDNSLYEWELVKNAKSLYENHNQPRFPVDNYMNIDYYNQANLDLIIRQVELAKTHGIYGFGIYYYWFSGERVLEKPLNIIFENKNINISFLLIWRNEDFIVNEVTLFDEKYDKVEIFIDDIKKYLDDPRYIRNNGRPIVGIYKPDNIIKLKIIPILRKKAKEKGIGDIFIIANFNGTKNEELNNTKMFDGGFEVPPHNLNFSDLMKYNFSYYYDGLLYTKNHLENITYNIPIYKGTMTEYDNSPKVSVNPTIFDEFSPEKFYIINKSIIDWTKNKYNSDNRFIFVNAWNNWSEGTYLEPDKKYGYASINALSKTLFNLQYKHTIYNLVNLKNATKILIQVHAFYDDLMPEVIQKTNNIPVNFDLYVSTNTLNKKIAIEEMIKNNSKAVNYEVKIVENKGRDVLPYLMQIKDIIHKYKYICHVHTKKTRFDPYLGEKWRNYLYNNLFGDEDLTSEILTDFESNSKLGLIFPETYYFQNYNFYKYNKNNIKYMNYLLGNIFPGKYYKIGKKIIFPVGNMFWARVKAVHQVFEQDINSICPKEADQKDATILHGIERIWLFVAKLNGYYFKSIFKYK